MTQTLLPPSASPQERAAEAAMARYEAGRAVPIRDLWRPDACPAALIPWLAWAVAVIVWLPGWSAAIKRRMIVDAMALHRIQGTRRAVEQVLATAGISHDPIVENPGGRRFRARLNLDALGLPAGVDLDDVRGWIEDAGRLSVEWNLSVADCRAGVVVRAAAAGVTVVAFGMRVDV